jgi:hypothetical protein
MTPTPLAAAMMVHREARPLMISVVNTVTLISVACVKAIATTTINAKAD